MNTYLLMSIKTKHANKIFNGTKTFEYRTKSIGEKNLNKYCFIYSSEFDKAIIGYVIFDYIVSGDFNYVMNNSNPEDIKLLKEYFKDKNECHALHIKEYKLFDKAIKLNELRQIDNKFSVPQFYRYIKTNEKLFLLLKKIKL